MERREFSRSQVTDAPQLRSELLLVDRSDREWRLPGDLWDVSESGASLISPRHEALVDLPVGQRLRLVVSYGDLVLHLEAELRHSRAVSGTAVVLGMRLRRTPASADSLDHWPGLLWELRCRGGLRDTPALLRDAG